METKAKRKKKITKARESVARIKAKKASAKPEKQGDVSVVPVYDAKGKEVGDFALDKKIFDGKVNTSALYHAVRMHNANRRQGNASTKTRGDVSGGGKKPWRQKGTGRARAGSTRSPLWRHGGVIFGPHPRDYHYDIPVKVRRLAFLSSINSKLNDRKVLGIDSIAIDAPKTKKIKAILDALKLEGKNLLVLGSMDQNVMRASRNLQELVVRNYKDFNTLDVLTCDSLLITRPALEKLAERFKA